MDEAQENALTKIREIRTSLNNLAEAILMPMFNEKGLGIISKNLEDMSSQISDIGWLTTLEKE